MGVSRFCTQEQLFEKKKAARDPEAVPVFDGNKFTEAGLFWEDSILGYIAAAMQGTLAVEQVQRLEVCQNHPWLGATLDARIWAKFEPSDESVLVEWLKVHDSGQTYHGEQAKNHLLTRLGTHTAVLDVKNLSSGSHAKWSDPNKIPDGYEWQMQGQLLVEPLPWALLMARIDANKLVGYVIEPDELMQETILHSGREFMDRLEEVEK
jgi:hypothetical protein